jgi:hypothetical protein
MLWSMADLDGGVKAYIEYLDKEMTIMGILSTFCVAAAALVVERIAGAEKTSYLATTIWAKHMGLVSASSGLLLAAGLFFYLQRSHLAYLYGSICISLARPASSAWDTMRWLQEADSWATWLRYRVGFMFLTLTALVIGAIAYRNFYLDLPKFFWLVLIAVALAFLGHNLVLSTYRYKAAPYSVFSSRGFIKDWRNRQKAT